MMLMFPNETTSTDYQVSSVYVTCENCWLTSLSLSFSDKNGVYVEHFRSILKVACFY